MTRAPDNLLAVRRLLIDNLGPAARPQAGVVILDPLGDPAWEVGIVGDADHRGGYHCGSDRVVTRDYSVIESPRDRAGLTLDAAALDVGRFKVRTPKGTFDLPHYSRWLVQQCEAGTDDTRHIREVIYSPDGRTVRRWDRLRKRTSGDKSHLGHTHESYFRDAIKAGADLTAVKRRYLATIGLGLSPEEQMFCKINDQGDNVKALQVRLRNLGYDLGAAGIDGKYGQSTKTALAAACRAVNAKSTADGSAYDPYTMFYVDILIARKYGGGPSGPGGITMAEVLAELGTRLGAGPPKA